MSASYIMSGDTLSIFVDGKTHTVTRDHSSFTKITSILKRKAWSELTQELNELERLRGMTSQVFEEEISEEKQGSGLYIDDEGNFYEDGERIDNYLTRKISELFNLGLPIDPLVNFYRNLMENPSKRAVDELYGFLEYGKLPITEDGHFVAYKKVSGDFKDIRTGTFDNSVGSFCEMKRNQVDEDKNQTCSDGLHFCSKEYLRSYGSGHSNQVVILKINPRDVVSIPVDYNHTKGRCCLYEVIGEYKDLTQDLSEYSVYSSDGDEYTGTDGWDDDFEDDEDFGEDDIDMSLEDDDLLDDVVTDEEIEIQKHEDMFVETEDLVSKEFDIPKDVEPEPEEDQVSIVTKISELWKKI